MFYKKCTVQVNARCMQKNISLDLLHLNKLLLLERRGSDQQLVKTGLSPLTLRQLKSWLWILRNLFKPSPWFHPRNALTVLCLVLCTGHRNSEHCNSHGEDGCSAHQSGFHWGEQRRNGHLWIGGVQVFWRGCHQSKFILCACFPWLYAFPCRPGEGEAEPELTNKPGFKWIRRKFVRAEKGVRYLSRVTLLTFNGKWASNSYLCLWKSPPLGYICNAKKGRQHQGSDPGSTD